MKNNELFTTAESIETFRFLDGYYSYEISSSALGQYTQDSPAEITASLAGAQIEDDQLSVNVQVHDADGNGGWTVQWQMESNGGWANLLNETSHILHLDQMHVGKLVRAEITHTDDKGNVTVVYSNDNRVINVNDDPTGNISISGDVL